MIKYLILIPLVIFPYTIFAQEYNYKEIVEWAKQTFEENDAGASYIIEKKGRQAYAIHNKLIQEKVDTITTPVSCQNVIREWLSFFRSAHIEFHYMPEARRLMAEKKNQINNAKEQISNTIEGNSLHNKYLYSKIPFIELINEHTLYLRIPSFSGKEKSKIDSLIALNRSRILSTESLIIDIRNGTGGGDASYSEILPLLYANPIRVPGVEYFSTKLNNQRMHELATNTGIAIRFGLNSTAEEMKKFQADYDTLSNHLGEFVNLNSERVQITKYDTIYPYPKNVGILINGNNVSTDEQFLLEARQSKKVKLFGTTTKGGLDFSNLYLTYYSPNKDFVLVYALTRSLRVPGMVVDNIGIQPDFYIDNEIPESEWIDYVNEILNE